MSQKIIITEIQNPKFQSNIRANVTVQRHVAGAPASKGIVGDKKKALKTSSSEQDTTSVNGRKKGETIRDFLVENQYESRAGDENFDPLYGGTRARPRAKYSFHPEFNAHFAIRDRVTVKRRDTSEMVDVQWFGSKLPISRSNREVFFPHSAEEKEVGIISTDAIMKKRSSSGAPVSQHVNIVYEDPQIAAMALHEARVREEEEKLEKIEQFRDRVKERVEKLQREERQRQKALGGPKSPTPQEKMRLYGEKIYKNNLKRYNKEALKKQEEQEKAKKYKELIQKQQEEAKRQQMLQMEQEIYASKLPDRHAHQFSVRGDTRQSHRGSVGTVSRRSVLNSARGLDTEGIHSARSIPLTARSDDLQEHNRTENIVPKLPLGETGQGSALQKKVDAYTKYRDEEYNAALEEDRYIEALRLQLIAKVKQQNIELPPLCGCGLNPFDNHPLKCCNNCEFYRNPSAYVRQLESLLYSYGITIS